MVRSDRKLFRLLTDEVCYGILRALVESPEPLAQRELVRLLDVASSTISRRIIDLEDIGLVERTSKHGTCNLVYESTTRELLNASAELMAMTHAKMSDDASAVANALRAPRSPRPYPVAPERQTP